MGVLGDIKDSISDSSGSGSSGGSSGFDDSRFNSSFEGGSSDRGQGARTGDLQGFDDSPGAETRGNPSNPDLKPETGGGDHGRSRPREPAGNTPAGRDSPRGDDIPNAQAGRPRRGGSEPQLSDQTRREMENAGFDTSGRESRGGPGQQPRSRDREQVRDSVAENRNEIEELKAQNEQIIELLKRITDALESGGRRR